MQGNRIKEVMVAMNWSNADLCRAIKSKGHQVTDQAIGKWISGATQNIRGEYFYAIEDLTGYSARWMIEGKSPKRRSEQTLTMMGIFEKLSSEHQAACLATGLALLNQQNAAAGNESLAAD